MPENAAGRWQKGGSKQKRVLFELKLFDRIQKEIKDHYQEDFIMRIIAKLKTHPRFSNLWYSLGLLLSDADKYELANDVFNKVVILNPNHKKLWIAKARVLGKMGREEEAAYCFQRGIECYGGKKKENQKIKEVVRDIDDFVGELEDMKVELGLGDMKKEDLEYIAPNVLDLESFISELITIRDRERDEAKLLIERLKALEIRGKDIRNYP